jgi:site-specific recombinase XerD
MKDPRTACSGGLPGEIEGLLADFVSYLHRERALAPTTIENYLNQVRPFATWYAQHCSPSLTTVTIHDVNEFITWRARTCAPGSISVAATALRTLLRWMFLDGRLHQQLAEAIGPVRYCGQAGMPKTLATAEMASLMAVDMSVRDRAVILLLARLGLRSREVADLTLDDINWRSGRMKITGKGNECQLMPLPAEVGESLATYLRHDRGHGTAHRHVFLAATAPHSPLDRTGVSSIVTRLARRAGLDGRVGAHRLRHSAATAVLTNGGTLAEAGQLLRHRSVAATAIYAKVAPDALAELVRPWPATTKQAVR